MQDDTSTTPVETARLFPLPNLVFFPHVMQPLHIFEPRYRQMTADALADDRRIALVLPKPGWETNYAGAPAIHSVATLGTIVTDHQLEDGRYNLLLRGVCRIRILEELPTQKLYRSARVQTLADYAVDGADREHHWRNVLHAEASRWFGGQGEVLEQFRKLLKSHLPLGPLADIVAFAQPLDADFKQSLLEQPCVETRLEMLVARLGRTRRPFPPDFSAN